MVYTVLGHIVKYGIGLLGNIILLGVFLMGHVGFRFVENCLLGMVYMGAYYLWNLLSLGHIFLWGIISLGIVSKE